MKKSKSKQNERKKSKHPATSKSPIKKGIYANQGLFQKIFWSIIGVFSILIISSSLTIGIPGDEAIDDAYGQSALKYYASFGKDTSFVELTVYGRKFNLQKYYGAGFEMPAAAISSLTSGSNRYTIRHSLVAICGILILVFTGLLCKELIGWEASCLAAIMLATTPTFVGNMLFNSKDIPFAMGFVISFYYFIKFSRSFPTPKRSDIIGVILGIAIAASIRIGGVLLVFYLFVLLGMKVLFEKDFRKNILSKDLREQIKLASIPVIMAAAGCLLGFLFYPNFWEHPIQHVSEALRVATDFPAKIRMLFEGNMIYSTSLPPNYLLKSLGITLPIFMLLLIPMILVFIPKMIKKHGASIVMFLLFACVFPIVYVLFKESSIYNGWRHILFFYPALVILASILITHILFPFKQSTPQFLVIMFLTYFFMNVIVWQIPNHAYQYAYYNEIVGGFEKAYKKYDTDYQQLAVSKGVEWLIENEEIFNDKSRKKKIRIASNNASALNIYFDTAAMNIQFISTGIKQWKDIDWDFAVLSTIFLQPKVRDLVFPPKDAIYIEQVDGRGLAYVVERPNKSDYQGLVALRKKQYNQAIPLLLQAYQYDPENFNVWANLGFAFASIRNWEETIKYLTKYMEIYPNNWRVNQLLGISYFNKKDYANGEKFLVRAVNMKPDQKEIYQNLINLYNQSGQTAKANNIQQKLSSLK